MITALIIVFLGASLLIAYKVPRKRRTPALSALDAAAVTLVAQIGASQKWDSDEIYVAIFVIATSLLFHGMVMLCWDEE